MLKNPGSKADMLKLICISTRLVQPYVTLTLLMSSVYIHEAPICQVIL